MLKYVKNFLYCVFDAWLRLCACVSECFCIHAKVIIMMMKRTGWIKTEVDTAYQVVLLYSSPTALKFLGGSSGRLRDKLCFPKTKQLVDIRQPPSAEARSADHNFVDS